MNRTNTVIFYSVIAVTYAWLWYSLTVLKNPMLCVAIYHPVLCLGGGLLIRSRSAKINIENPPIQFKLALFFTLGLAVLTSLVLWTSSTLLLRPTLIDPMYLTDGLDALGMDKAHFWLAASWIAVVNPFAEEFLWRVNTLGFFMGRMNRAMAMFVMAILFAGYHPLITMTMIPSEWLVVVFVLTFIGGLILGELYLRTRRIGWSIFLHLVINVNLMLIGWQYAPL